MREPTPSCFRGVAAATPPGNTAVGPTLITSVYETQHGVAALTWSRTVVGLSLRAELRLPLFSSFGSASSSVSSSAVSLSSDSGFDGFSFRFSPWVLWKRRGTKRFHVKDKDHQEQQNHRKVDFAWDLSCACFPTTGGPEPASGFFIAVAIDGEMFLFVGDMPEEEARRKIKTKKSLCHKPSSFIKGSPKGPILVSRSEHVFLPDCSNGRPYTTNVRMGGKQREISIDLGGGREKDAKLCIDLDGKRILRVKRLRWKFRGNEKVNTDSSDGGGGGRIQVSWDVHNWLFNSTNGGGTANPADKCHAMFVFRFDRNQAEEGQFGRGGGGPWGMYGLSCFGNSERNPTNSRSGSGGGWRKRRLLKTSSFSSSASTASSTSSLSVMGWASSEENELRQSDGFFLFVHVWKR